ncbi:hypothetical protein [Mycobacterium paraense]|uniref:hypothetical protein n=1 Tax=Mycobacterium paraense TaxID=767916 RepID=UPI00111BFE8F|nr:hypothetical protein [Mycobacterium paraense]
MAGVGVADALIAGIPSMVVAVVGVVGIVITQARADARQDRIAAAGRQFERAARTLDQRREAGAELMAAVLALARHSRDVVGDGGDYSDLEPGETADVDRALSRVLMVCDSTGRRAATALMDALIAWVGAFSDETWHGIDVAEDNFVEAINGEAGGADHSHDAPAGQRSVRRFGFRGLANRRPQRRPPEKHQ